MTIRMRRIIAIIFFVSMAIGLYSAVTYYVRVTDSVVQEEVKGPQPVVTDGAIAHMTERHLRPELYPEKSKFIADSDLQVLVSEVYEHAFQARRGDRGKYIYDHDCNRPVGTEGQTVVRLVTAADGRVITMYPMHARQGHKKAA